MAAPLELETPQGTACVHLHPVDDPRAAIVLGHGAGGSVTARDLQVATRVAREAGLTAALVEQPYRVAGRRSTPAAKLLDAAWTAVVEQLRAGPLADLPLVAGGRSSGARVACRTAHALDVAAVLCLAFPLQPPARAGKAPPPSRQDELDAVDLPVLVVQGENDRFGMPRPAGQRTVAVVRGDHRLSSDLDAVAAAVAAWLARVLDPAAARS